MLLWHSKPSMSFWNLNEVGWFENYLVTTIQTIHTPFLLKLYQVWRAIKLKAHTKSWRVTAYNICSSLAARHKQLTECPSSALSIRAETTLGTNQSALSSAKVFAPHCLCSAPKVWGTVHSGAGSLTCKVQLIPIPAGTAGVNSNRNLMKFKKKKKKTIFVSCLIVSCSCSHFKTFLTGSNLAFPDSMSWKICKDSLAKAATSVSSRFFEIG